ncbi:DUF6624 domain-containing protein [Pseudovibrio japonicus]|nr:DUF6624 domain-containing protein [Pseudovibrio japonicus]
MVLAFSFQWHSLSYLHAAPSTNELSNVRAELLNMAENDQDIRKVFVKEGYTDLTAQKMHEIDTRNTQRLKEIIGYYGWLKTEDIETDGLNAIWLIIQHSPDYDFQEEFLPFAKRSFHAGELSGQNYALLTDRVLVHNGKAQRYGTQFKIGTDQKAIPYTIADPQNVDKRRADVGLPSLSQYSDLLNNYYSDKQP